MNQLSTDKRTQVVKALMEGVGVNATHRLNGVCKPAILKLLADLGRACFHFHDDKTRGLKPNRAETDEVWSLVFAKEKSLRPEFRGIYGLGDCRLWTAIDPDSKLIISYLIGQRTPQDARDGRWVDRSKNDLGRANRADSVKTYQHPNFVPSADQLRHGVCQVRMRRVIIRRRGRAWV